jgi:hypothetical protein
MTGRAAQQRKKPAATASCQQADPGNLQLRRVSTTACVSAIHRGGLVDEVLDEAGQVPVHAVHVVDEELEDERVRLRDHRGKAVAERAIYRFVTACPMRGAAQGVR